MWFMLQSRCERQCTRCLHFAPHIWHSPFKLECIRRHLDHSINGTCLSLNSMVRDTSVVFQLEGAVPYACVGAKLVMALSGFSPTLPLNFPSERKEKFTLFSDHNGSLPRRQPGAMTIGHSPKGKEKILNLRVSLRTVNWYRSCCTTAKRACIICHFYGLEDQV